MRISFAIAATALALGAVSVGPLAHAEQKRHRHHLDEGRSVEVQKEPYYNFDHVPVRPGPPGSGLCNTVQIAAGNCPYPSH